MTKRQNERSILMPLLKTTLYGPFAPDSEKDKLLHIVESLRTAGFHDTDIVSGDLRPNRWNYDRLEISKFYLENSDVNYLIFTLDGACRGLISEFDFLASSAMRHKWPASIVFYEVRGKRKALGPLQRDKLESLNTRRQRLCHFEFRSLDHLTESIISATHDEYKVLGDVLRNRMP